MSQCPIRYDTTVYGGSFAHPDIAIGGQHGVIGQDNNTVEYENTVAPDVTLADVAPLCPHPIQTLPLRYLTLLLQ